MRWSGSVWRSFVPDSGLASTECRLRHTVLRETWEEPFERPLSNLVVDFCSPLFLKDCVAVYCQDVVWQSWTRSCIARMTSALPKSWSAMHCRSLTETPSVRLPAVTVETLAMFCTSPSRGAAADVFCFLRVPLRSDFCVGQVEFQQEGRHQEGVTQNVTIVHVPSVRKASVFLQRVTRVVQLEVGGYLLSDWVICLQALRI